MFENDNVFVLKVDPETNSIIDASESFKKVFGIDHVVGKTLRECVGCQGVDGKDCDSSIFSQGRVNISHITKCRHFKREFNVRYFKDKSENCNVLIFDNNEIDNLESIRSEDSEIDIDTIFSHEIMNVINRISLANQYIENLDKTKENIDWYIKHTSSNMGILSDLLISFNEYKKRIDRRCSEFSISCVLDSLFVRDIALLDNKKLTTSKQSLTDTEDFDSYMYDKFSDNDFLLFLMLSNIINNAVNYADENSEIAVKLDKSDDQYLMTIENYGQLSEHLEEKFFMKDKKEYNGSGYGLYFSKKIADRLGVGLEMKYDQGKVAVIFEF